MDFTADVEVKQDTDFLEFTNPNNRGPPGVAQHEPRDPPPPGTEPPPATPVLVGPGHVATPQNPAPPPGAPVGTIGAVPPPTEAPQG